MIYLNITPIILKFGVALDKSDSLIEEIEEQKEKFRFIKIETNINYKSKILFLFKISYFRINEFKESQDYKFLKDKLNINDNTLADSEKENLERYKNDNSIITESNIKNDDIPICYYCGDLTYKKEYIIFDLFQRKCIKSGNSIEFLIKGIDFLNNQKKTSFFNLSKRPVPSVICVGKGIKKINQKNRINFKHNLYPYLLTEGEEGTSVFRVDSINSFKKIGENSFGPTTLWSILTFFGGYEDPDNAAAEAKEGNNNLIDLSVGDIYGGNYENMSMNSDLIGSSFGKLRNIDDLTKIEKKDVLKSLCILYGASYSHVISLVSYKENLDKVIISGSPFNSLELFEIIQTSISRYSSGKINAVFNDYSDFCEIIGMFLESNDAHQIL